MAEERGAGGRATVVSLSIGEERTESALVQSPFLALHRHLAALRQTRERVLSGLCPPPRRGSGWWGWNEHVGRPRRVAEWRRRRGEGCKICCRNGVADECGRP